jgi:hypothetical protein
LQQKEDHTVLRIAGGVLAILVALPALADEDKVREKKAGDEHATPAVPLTVPGDKAKSPPVGGTPAEQYRALVNEYQTAVRNSMKAYKAAKTDAERAKVLREQYPQPAKLAPRFLTLAEKYPKDPAALDAILWVCTYAGKGLRDGPDLAARSMDLVLHYQLKSDRLGDVCQSLAYRADRQTADFLRAVLEKNPHKDVQGEACISLAQGLQRRAELVRLVKQGDTQVVPQYARFFGQKAADELAKDDADKLEAQSQGLYGDLTKKYLAEMKPDRVVALTQRLSYDTDPPGERILRELLAKDRRREVQGAACLYLAEALKNQADAQATTQPRKADRLRHEREELLERAATNYADVKLPYRGTVGARAEGELFETRHLAVGKPVPDIEGEDSDGKRFKLSDYRGKVVLLDFWGNW